MKVLAVALCETLLSRKVWAHTRWGAHYAQAGTEAQIGRAGWGGRGASGIHGVLPGSYTNRTLTEGWGQDTGGETMSAMPEVSQLWKYRRGDASREEPGEGGFHVSDGDPYVAI